MSKRFIDTEIFNDSWFMDLSVNAKLLYIYLFTNCDHAGIIDINWRLIEFQTGIKQLHKTYLTLSKEFNNRLIYLKNNYYFIPKFITFQYPGFPKSKVRQQEGALKRLIEFDIWDEKNMNFNKEILKSYESHSKELSNSYEYGPDTVSVNDNVNDSDNGEVEKEIIYPFGDKDFLDMWDIWKKFKKEQFRFIYKPIGEQTALKNLGELSLQNKEIAMKIIVQSISNGWKGFFTLKNDFNKSGMYDEFRLKNIKTMADGFS